MPSGLCKFLLLLNHFCDCWWQTCVVSDSLITNDDVYLWLLSTFTEAAWKHFLMCSCPGWKLTAGSSCRPDRLLWPRSFPTHSCCNTRWWHSQCDYWSPTPTKQKTKHTHKQTMWTELYHVTEKAVVIMGCSTHSQLYNVIFYSVLWVVINKYSF